MVLNDVWIKANSWMFNPYDETKVNPASIDLCWSGRYKTTVGYWKDESVKTWEKSDGLWTPMYEQDLLTICPGELYLLDTLETLQIPPDVCGMLMLKSSMGRYGLEHLHAGYFDPGFGYENPSTGTLEIHNVSPRCITIRKGQPIVQMMFLQMNAVPERDYRHTGRYNGQKSPQEAK